LRRLLSRSKNPPIEKVIESGLVVAMVQAIEHVQVFFEKYHSTIISGEKVFLGRKSTI
jgi:hypothetical protein